MRKAVARCACPILTNPLDPSKKGRTLFTPHLLTKRPSRPSKSLKGVSGRALELIVIRSQQLPEAPAAPR
jgi:hypothetical protein